MYIILQYLWLGIGLYYIFQGKMSEALICFVLSEIQHDRALKNIDNSKE